MKLLLSAGTDVNAANNFHKTPLHYAAARGHAKVVNLLLAEDVNVNAGIFNNTPLREAVKREHEKIVELLLASDADTNEKVTCKPTLLQLARKNKNKRITQLLLAAGARDENCCLFCLEDFITVCYCNIL